MVGRCGRGSEGVKNKKVKKGGNRVSIMMKAYFCFVTSFDEPHELTHAVSCSG